MTSSDGLLLVDKPSGPTSHDVIDRVRRVLGLRRVGHAGTLDPFASGLLLVLVGRATRLAQFLVGLSKRYEGSIRLGVATETDDRTGTVTVTRDGAERIPDSALQEAMASLTGAQLQHPPVYSAKKVGGRRAYRLARSGGTVELPAVEIEVFQFTPIAREGAAVRFEALVSSGTYVRALARDLGVRLGCGAHLAELRRTAVGSFEIGAAKPLGTLGEPDTTVLPLLAAVTHLERRALTDDERDAVAHGRPISAGAAPSTSIALVHADQLVAVAERSGDSLRPRVVLVDG